MKTNYLRTGILILFLFIFALLHSFNSYSQSSNQLFTENNYKAHVEFLADDLLEGRKPGTRGGDLAALYIAKQFESAGLKPVSKENGYYQYVPMVGFSADYNSVHCTISSDNKEETIVPYEEIILLSQDTITDVHIEGELIFVGYGIEAPEYKWDDFKDVDVSGKILVVLCNDPDNEKTGFGSERWTYYSLWTYKEEMAILKGAKGIIYLHNTEMADFPFFVVQNSVAPEWSYLKDRTKNPLSLYAWMSDSAFEKVLSETGFDVNQLIIKADNRDFKPFSLGLKIKADFKQNYRLYTSPNVIGILPGSEKKDEAILYMAHYDHLGIGKAIDGDSIYNGAQDNASGIAALISLAQVYSSNPTKRSIIFMATTGEESSMLGSEYYATHPMIPLENTIIGFNMDMMSFYGRRSGFILDPIEISDASEQISKLGEELNVQLLPDFKGSGAFRSDHFPLYSRGVIVPGIFLSGEYLTMTEEDVAKAENQIGDFYHLPKDEIYPSFRYDGVVQQMEMVYHIGRYYAEGDEKPKLLPENPYNAPMRFYKIKLDKGI
ncbi:MAG: M28 family peptidase [Bacteroidota bacterium]